MGASRRGRRIWHVLPAATDEQLRAVGPFPRLVAQLLYNRGIRSQSEAQSFLDPGLGPVMDPYLLPNADVAVARLVRAIKSGECIAVYGDFDADGVTSAALLAEGLRSVGAHVLPYIPDRVAEGHGLNMPALQDLRGRGASLVVTADCGISNVAEVAAARRLGMDTIITDHHAPPEQLPEAVALVDPKLKGAAPVYSDLASVGVASRLVDALHAKLGRAMDETLLEFVALGTVADMAPMRGQTNRDLVRRGLRQINGSSRPGMRELMRVSRIEAGHVDTETINYTLGPRINAPGRVDHARVAFELLVARSSVEAEPLAATLELRNLERQRLTRDILQRVEGSIQEPLPPIVILGDPEYAAGVVGLAAGKLADALRRPAVVCQVGREYTRGSCRSIPEFNIVEALRQCQDLLVRFGGHAQAAGFTIATRDFPLLKERLTSIAVATLTSEGPCPRIEIDAETPLDGVNGSIIRALPSLGPHGPQNPSPVFLSRNVEVRDVRLMGDQGQHMRLRLKGGGVTWSAVGFDIGFGEGLHGRTVDVVYTLSVNRWRGESVLQMRVLDIAPSNGMQGLPRPA